jgi:hypothetical protein
MNEHEWTERRSAVYDDVYEVLFRDAGCGPFDGGCLVVAQSLQQVLGGEIAVLVRDGTGSADHAVLLHDGMLWDFDGPLPPETFIERYQRTEMIGIPGGCVGHRPLEPLDLDEAIRDDNLVQKLADIFQTMLPEYGISPKP